MGRAIRIRIDAMKRALLLAASLPLLSTGVLAADETRDAKATAAAEREREAHGGKRWEKARFFRFEFNVDFGARKAGPIAHAWDRYTGAYRVDVPGDDGYTAYFNVNAPKDTAQAVILKKGERLSGEAAEKLLAKAYGRFINDSYWLLAPLKVLDPGVNLADEGTADFDGQRVNVIKLSFGPVGLTPGDVYKHFLDEKTGRMLGWEYQLQGTQPPPTRWKWIEWKELSGLFLSTRKVTDDGKAIFFTNVSVSEAVDAAVLAAPAAPSK